jgi:hypothetical protein
MRRSLPMVSIIKTAKGNTLIPRALLLAWARIVIRNFY